MVTFIGDVHGKYDEYLEIAQNHPKTIQVGDMGFEYEHMSKLNPKDHRFIGGNHDNWNIIHKCPNFLGRFGYLSDLELFFVSGAQSIDARQRILGVDWWENEELSYTEMVAAIKQYKSVKPKIVVSHDGPGMISEALFGMKEQSATRKMLEAMFDSWMPNYWIFGHWHETQSLKVRTTKFYCLAELDTITI